MRKMPSFFWIMLILAGFNVVRGMSIPDIGEKIDAYATVLVSLTIATWFVIDGAAKGKD